ncbi:MAG TPA: glycosyl hydrolase family 28 protein, partial [Anditalea sp.]|nr:glycosyl hydrolase family 28 protein [Anditalea sp.]
MQNFNLIYIAITSILLFSCAVNEETGGDPEFEWLEKVGAKNFPEGTTEYSVNDFGAVSDTTALSTEAIQQAIDKCAEEGGGIVTFDKGDYLSGPIFVKSGVNLRIDEGVTLYGSQDIAQYPDMPTRVAGIEMVWPAALINVIEQTNAAVTGKGDIHAQGKVFWDEYWATRKDYEKQGLRWIVDYDVKRPRTLLVSESSDITIEDLTMKQAGFWTVHILYSQNITARGLVIQNN